MQRFTDKTVLITGAGSGMGQASAFRIADEGGHVLCADINLEAATATAATISAKGQRAHAIQVDISDKKSAQQCIEQALKLSPQLHALCNIAGVLRFDNTLELELEDWQQIIGINLTGTFLMCQAAIPALLKTKGSIVNMASTAALGAHAWTAAYAASKGGVLSMTKTLAIEFGKQGLNANSLSPASVETPMSNDVSLPEGADMSLLKKVLPFDDVTRPASDVASLIAFLASDDAVHINGIDVRIDGGMMM